MSQILGAPTPRFVIKKEGHVDYEFRVTGFKDYTPTYTPDFIRHKLQDGVLKSSQRELAFSAEIYFEGIKEIQQLINLSRLYHQMDLGDEAGYDQVLFYPHWIDAPEIEIEVTIGDDDMVLNYFRMWAMKEFTLKLIGANPVDFPPLALPSYLIVMRNIWSINPDGAVVDFPGLFTSANYWVNPRALDGTNITGITRRTNGFTAYGDLNGGIARYLAVDQALDTKVGSKFRLNSCVIGTANTAIAFSSALPSGNCWLDVRALDGTQIEIVSWNANGFTAKCSQAGTECMYLAVDPSVTDFEQSKIKVWDAVVTEAGTPIAIPGTAFPRDNFWFDVRAIDGSTFIDILSNTTNSITAKPQVASDTPVRCFAVYQEAP